MLQKCRYRPGGGRYNGESDNGDFDTFKVACGPVVVGVETTEGADTRYVVLRFEGPATAFLVLPFILSRTICSTARRKC